VLLLRDLPPGLCIPSCGSTGLLWLQTSALTLSRGRRCLTWCATVSRLSCGMQLCCSWSGGRLDFQDGKATWHGAAACLSSKRGHCPVGSSDVTWACCSSYSQSAASFVVMPPRTAAPFRILVAQSGYRVRDAKTKSYCTGVKAPPCLFSCCSAGNGC
jgi:hypothetical protein